MSADASEISVEALGDALELDGFDRPAERAYQGIRRAILTGALKGGLHLREEALAKMTGTSRTPVRDALGRLVAEGLARAEGRSRFVADFPFEEVAIIFDIRARLESYAARIAAQNIQPEEIDTLARLIDDIDDVIAHPGAEGAIQKFAALNTRFHATIITATRSQQMKTLSAQATSIPLEMIKQFVWSQSVNMVRSNLQHREIHAALAAGNPAWAEAVMSAHILSTRPVRPLHRDAAARGLPGKPLNR